MKKITSGFSPVRVLARLRVGFGRGRKMHVGQAPSVPSRPPPDFTKNSASRTQGILRSLRAYKTRSVVVVAMSALLLTGAVGQTQTPPDPHEVELQTKVGRLVDTRFNGDVDRAFAHYARLAVDDGSVDKDELWTLLRDADVGNIFTRSTWASRIIERFDNEPGGTRNGRVDLHELQSAIGD